MRYGKERPSAMWKRSAIIVPGAQKSGTTTLFKMLAAHSRVDRSGLKEPQFFALPPEEIEKKFSWYENLFSHEDGTILLDASTFYFRSAAAPAMIRKYIAEPRIVILLRDPAQRAYSSYLHMLTREPPAERRDFEAVLEATAEAVGRGLSVPQAENEVLGRAVEQGQVDADYLDEGYHRRFYGAAGAAIRTNVEDPLFLYKYFQQSLYREDVDRYVKAFGAERVKVVLFEELIADPETTMRSVLGFLGLAPERAALELVHGNKTHPPRSVLKKRLLAFRKDSAALDALISGLNGLGLGPVVRRVEQFVRKPPPKPALTEAHYKRARALLAGEYAYWQAQRAACAQLWSY